MSNRSLHVSRLCLALLTACSWPVQSADQPPGEQQDGPFRKVVLEWDRDTNGDGQPEDTLLDPMELSVAKDGRVFYAQRNGIVKVWKPSDKSSTVIGKLDVFTGLEDGLLGLTLDPNFEQNGWIYLYHALPETTRDANGKKAGQNVISRFTVRGDQIDMGSEKVLLRVNTQREECCHSGGSLTFDSKGNLYQSAGDNTNPFASNGFDPIDERPGRFPWDSQKSAANPNDLRGHINRIHPEPDGSVTIPAGNLFPPGTEGTRPEIFVMGCRNPFRISVDPKNGYLYWGDVGPDAQTSNPKRGPAGFDEINQARGPGFFGWPYFIANNKPYVEYDFSTKQSGKPFDPQHPVNNSPNNTGRHDLPPAQPAFIYYPYSASTHFPPLGSGGRTAMAGPVYYFDENLKSEHKLPKEFDHTFFAYEWTRNWIMAVHLDENDHIEKIEPFLKNMTFKRPMDMELGPDGCLYLIEFGTNWGNNKDTKIERIEYHAE